ncbi:MAG TPA: glycosyltransferase [Dehalococcoidia bacterium]|nr:glycosyltransferase [Dehalococcoidia bacterium]
MKILEKGPAKASSVNHRPTVKGKYFFVGRRKLYTRGVTYGTFRPGEEQTFFPAPDVVEKDFATMAELGINAVRTYTTPPRWLLDAAARHGLYLLLGLAWEQHVAFLENQDQVKSIQRRVRDDVRHCAGHPAILAYAIGNEIPAPMVRWQGRRKIERFLESLYRVVKREDPAALVTYINYPTTEYLQLPFLDFVCFNVYLENQDSFSNYLARLHNLAGDRPLCLAEIGLDSRRNGEMEQADSLDWQVRRAFADGCAGAFVFAWTDEWYRGGYDIEDWDFGLTRRDRSPKPALSRVCQAFREIPFPPDTRWPFISVVVCSYNGARTIRDTFEALQELDYPNYDVIVVNDGSRDATASIARDYPFRLIETENRGLSNARNTGMAAARGDIVAYIDDDAYPDPHWLTNLAATFLRGDYGGVGGPNIAPPGDGLIADCIANAPGGPVHVLLTDRIAEHIPGCNMAFRRSALLEIGGFDPIYRAAGDDVDLCWRLQERGYTIGFNPAAVDWHHRRNSVRAYWKQQVGYGRAEALLERKWPERYNSAGHLSWSGRLYGKGLTRALTIGRSRIYQGSGGNALFQSIYQPAAGIPSSLPLMPEWYLLVLALGALSVLGVFWTPLLLALPFLAISIGAVLGQAIISGARASFTSEPLSGGTRLGMRVLTALLHLLQPMARLNGRIRHGLTLWRRRGPCGWALPLPRSRTVWSEDWQEPQQWLQVFRASLKGTGAVAVPGGDYENWDLEVRGGLLSSIRLRMTVEEHGAGRQLLRFRCWPRLSFRVLGLLLVLAGLAGLAAWDLAWIAAGVLGLLAALLVYRFILEGSTAMAVALRSLPNSADGGS